MLLLRLQIGERELADSQLVVDLSPYLTQLFLAVATGVIAFVGNEVRKFTKSRFNNEQLSVLSNVATIGVQAAEQLYGALGGEQKKDFAFQYAQAELAKRGIKVDPDQLSTIIEAAVLAEFNYPAAVEPAQSPSETVVESSADQAGQVVTDTPV